MQKSLYRIIDVNFNRAREAARVMEEFARFALNNEALSGKVKSLRHRLSGLISSIDDGSFIMARDSAGDVGLGLKVAGQLRRVAIADVFTAAAKRLPEALRTLSETTQTFAPQVAADIEVLRFEAYEIEKEIFIKLNIGKLYDNVRLYVLVDCLPFDEFKKLVEQCIAGGADCIQLRCKDAEDGEKYEYACRLVNICKGSEVLTIINDSVDIAIASGASGVHLGQTDMPLKVAKGLLSRPMLAGVSTHNTTQLVKAIEGGADYVGIGPAFATGTKPGLEVAGLGYVRKATAALKGCSIGHTAIGGIDETNIDEVIAAGAKTVAVYSAVVKSPNPKAACQKLKQKLTQ